MDPVTVFAAAKASFSAIQTAIKYGKDLQSMVGDVSKLLGAANSLTKIAVEPKGGWGNSVSAEELALKAFTARKQVEEMQQSVRNAIVGEYGQGAWDELLQEITRIRKEQKAAAKQKAEAKIEQAKTNFTVFILIAVVFGVALLVNFALSLR